MEKRFSLFKQSKQGRILEFNVIVRSLEDGALLITQKGYLEGAMQEDVEPIYPKNVGRANETSPWQQALMQAISKVNKLKDKGYKILDLEEMDWPTFKKTLSDAFGTDASGDMLPMLAQKDVDKITFPGYLQRKYDGVRCKGTNPMMKSRRGKEFHTLRHIQDIIPALPEGWALDGELYHPTRSLQQIVSMVKREQPDNKKIVYRVYDLMAPGVPYSRRRKLLKDLFDQIPEGPIQQVETFRVNSMEEVVELFSQFRAEGYEGAMWRSPQGLYESGTRSWGLIKIKDFQEDEFEITGVDEATGRDAGTAIFILQTEAGMEFRARPMGTRELRAEYLKDSDNLIGEMATVRFQQWTDDGKPFHGRVVNIRDYEIQGG
jgi:DNA ligase-1